MELDENFRKSIFDEMAANHRVHERQQSISGEPPVPDGGWGWIVIIASFLIHVMADGAVYSYGVLVPYFLDEFPEATRANVGGIGSMMVGVTWGCGKIIYCLFLSCIIHFR